MVHSRLDHAHTTWTSLSGKASVVKGSNNSRLKAQFFWPLRGDYQVLELADDYSYAVVGNQTRRYMWILSRTPQMDPLLYGEILNRMKEQGFPVETLVISRQEGCIRE